MKIFFEYHFIDSFAKTINLKNKLLYFLLFLWALTASSQTIFYDQLDIKSGLPSSVVYDIFQDSKGFIWIASDEGLLKYNGYDFQKFKSILEELEFHSLLRKINFDINSNDSFTEKMSKKEDKIL